MNSKGIKTAKKFLDEKEINYRRIISD